METTQTKNRSLRNKVTMKPKKRETSKGSKSIIRNSSKQKKEGICSSKQRREKSINYIPSLYEKNPTTIHLNKPIQKCMNKNILSPFYNSNSINQSKKSKITLKRSQFNPLVNKKDKEKENFIPDTHRNFKIENQRKGSFLSKAVISHSINRKSALKTGGSMIGITYDRLVDRSKSRSKKSINAGFKEPLCWYNQAETSLSANRKHSKICFPNSDVSQRKVGLSIFKNGNKSLLNNKKPLSRLSNSNNCKPFIIENGFSRDFREEDNCFDTIGYLPYIKNIVIHLARKEQLQFNPGRNPGLVQTEITPQMRVILFDWLISVSQHFKLRERTLQMCLACIDAYQNRYFIKKEEYQLIGISSLFVCSKYEEIYPPKLSDFVKTCNSFFSEQMFIEVETRLLTILSFDLSFVLDFDFFNFFAKIGSLSDEHIQFGIFLLTISKFKSKFNNVSPSLLAFSLCFFIQKLFQTSVFYEIDNYCSENQINCNIFQGEFAYTNNLGVSQQYYIKFNHQAVRNLAGDLFDLKNSYNSNKKPSLDKKFKNSQFQHSKIYIH